MYPLMVLSGITDSWPASIPPSDLLMAFSRGVGSNMAAPKPSPCAISSRPITTITACVDNPTMSLSEDKDEEEGILAAASKWYPPPKMYRRASPEYMYHGKPPSSSWANRCSKAE